MNLSRWLTTTNHKDIGILYILGAFLFGFIGGILALLQKTQTAFPESNLIPPAFYNQVITVHGLVMVLWFASPLAIGLANYFVPLMIGSRDLAFPRLNALSFWLFLFGGLVAASAFLFPGGAIATGWTIYAPLNTPKYSAGNAFGVILGIAGAAMLIASVTVGTINFLTTIALMRAPGMTLLRMPLFVWFMVGTFILMFFIFPVLLMGGLMLLFDWLFGTNFFSAPHGSLLWDHVFWFFGHPEVYVVLFPAMGVLAEIIPVFARRSIYGKNIIIASMITATIMSLIVWGHHMFITGVSPAWRLYMSIATELISIPIGIITLCFIATLWKGLVRFTTPMLFALGAIALFIPGGAMGVFNSSAALDYTIRGTYWIVSHFHLILAGVVVMSLLGGVYYWFPKISGRMYNEVLGKIHALLTILGIIVFALPLAFTRMPRRYPVYPAAETTWAQMHLISTVGAYIILIAQLIFVYNIIVSLLRGPRAAADPWGGYSIEWTVSSPPPPTTFVERPVISPKGVLAYVPYPATEKPSELAPKPSIEVIPELKLKEEEA